MFNTTHTVISYCRTTSDRLNRDMLDSVYFKLNDSGSLTMNSAFFSPILLFYSNY